MSLAVAAETKRPGTVRCQACPWAKEVPDMDTAMSLFEQHTKDGHQVNPYSVGASFHCKPDIDSLVRKTRRDWTRSWVEMQERRFAEIFGT